MAEVELIQVIRTMLEKRGKGQTNEDPVRRIIQYWSLDGKFLAEMDPINDTKPAGIDKE